jgi:hypothetical protein
MIINAQRVMCATVRMPVAANLSSLTGSEFEGRYLTLAFESHLRILIMMLRLATVRSREIMINEPEVLHRFKLVGERRLGVPSG